MAVIKEFLVALGFRLNTSDERRFNEGLRRTDAQAAELNETLASVGKELGVLGARLSALSDTPTKKTVDAADRINKSQKQLLTNVKSLGVQAAATAGVFVASFERIAREYNNLYYVAQRTGLSVSELSAQRFAGPQIGNTAADMQAAQEAFSTALRNPGLKAMAASLGAADGNVISLFRHLKQLPPYLQDVYAGMFGINTTVMRNWAANSEIADKAMADFRRRSREAGLDQSKLANDAVAFQRELNKLMSTLGITMDKMFENAHPVAMEVLDTLNKLAEANNRLLRDDPGLIWAESLGLAYAGAMGLLGALGLVSGKAAAMSSAMAGLVGAVAPLAAFAYFFRPYPLNVGEKNTPEYEAEQRRQSGDPAIQRQLRESRAADRADSEHDVYNFGMMIGKVLGALSGNPSFGSAFRFRGKAAGGSEGGGGEEETPSTAAIGEWLNGSTTHIPVVRVAGFDEAMRWSSVIGSGAGGTGSSRPSTSTGGGSLGRPAPSTGSQTLPSTSGMTAPGMPTAGDPRGMIPVIRAAAIANGIDPDIAVRVARGEGLGKFSGDGGKSGTAFHMFTGGGLGNIYQKETGRDPLDPANEVHAINWMMANVKRFGWHHFHATTQRGNPAYGIGDREGFGKSPVSVGGAYGTGTDKPVSGVARPRAMEPGKSFGNLPEGQFRRYLDTLPGRGEIPAVGNQMMAHRNRGALNWIPNAQIGGGGSGLMDPNQGADTAGNSFAMNQTNNITVTPEAVGRVGAMLDVTGNAMLRNAKAAMN